MKHIITKSDVPIENPNALISKYLIVYKNMLQFLEIFIFRLPSSVHIHNIYILCYEQEPEKKLPTFSLTAADGEK
jgi:hypothetical protein